MSQRVAFTAPSPDRVPTEVVFFDEMVACINDVNIAVGIDTEVCRIPELLWTTTEAATCYNWDPRNVEFNPAMIAGIYIILLAISPDNDTFRLV